MPNDKVSTGLERSGAAQLYRVSDNFAQTGWLVVEEGRPLVNFPANPHGPMPARWLAHVDLHALVSDTPEAHELLLVFENGRPDMPIVAGVLRPVEHEIALDSPPSDLRLDDRHLEFEAVDELVLRCGKASLILRRNGRVVLRGVQVETRASGRARITGGSVEIN